MWGRGSGHGYYGFGLPRRSRTYGVKVSSIPSVCSTVELQRLFMKYGQCNIRMGDSSMKSRADTPQYYAYINFYDLFNAKKAVEEMNGYEVVRGSGTRLSVKLQGSEAASMSAAPPMCSPQPQKHTVKVTNIPKLVTQSELSKLFSFDETVQVASLKLNQTTVDVNFAYVNYTNSADADQAVSILNGGIVKGSNLIVKRHGNSIQNTAVTGTSSSTLGSSIKVVITEGLVDENELYDFFAQFGELKNVSEIRGSPKYAHINYKNPTDARKASQYRSLQIKPGVTVKVRPPIDAPISVTPTTGAAFSLFQPQPKALLPLTAATAVSKPFHTKPKAPLCESKKIQCGSVIAQILTSSDPKYVQYQQSLLPVTINRDKSGSGIILFGAHTSLSAAESLVTALITELQREHAEKEIELPCMYVPAFYNQALVNSLSDIEQEFLIRFLVCVTAECMQDIVAFSKMVYSKLTSSEAVELSSLGIALHQKGSTGVTHSASKSTCFTWLWKDDHRSYTPYDQDSCAKLNKHYDSSPQGSLQLCITTKLGSTQYCVNFSTMTQVNTETGHIRKIKNSIDSSLSPTWLYEGDTKKMVPYSASECLDVERMYLANKPEDLVINSRTYTFDFIRMKQINKSTRFERKIERQSAVGMPTHETFLKLQMSGSQDNFEKAETKLVEELDTAVVKKTHPLPVGADRAFQTEILQLLRKYFVVSEIVGDNVQVQGVQGYIEKVMLILRERTLEFEKERLSQVPATPHSASVPKSWEPQTDQFDAKELPRNGTEWNEIKSKIRKTLPSVLITSIKRIQNKWLWDRYSFAKQRMSDRNAGVINEKQLFHGTRSTPPEKIYKSEQGFDFRFSTKGLWGTGTYFAINASYSDNYCYQSPQGKQMILASVLTGETHRCSPDGSLKKPPINPRKCGSFEDELYDSVSGHTNGSDVFIIYDHEKAYPSYLITYSTQHTLPFF